MTAPLCFGADGVMPPEAALVVMHPNGSGVWDISPQVSKVEKSRLKCPKWQ